MALGTDNILHKIFSFWGKIRTRALEARHLEDRVFPVLLYLAASVLLLFCTRNSPIFAYQEWIDPNIYMDVGRAIRNGLVLYRDVFDHKGPLIHLVLAALSAIPPLSASMTGFYLLQCFTLSLSLHYIYRTARRFLKPAPAVFAGICFLAVLFQPIAYRQGGSVEELLLPLFCGGIYALVTRFGPRFDIDATAAFPKVPDFVPEERNEDPTSTSTYYLLGLYLGIAALTKINLALFFAVVLVFLWIPILRSGRFGLLGRSVGLAGAGVLSAALPAILYFAATNSFADFFDAYIRFNLTYAGRAANVTGPSTMGETILMALYLNIPTILLLIAGLIFFIRSRKKFSRAGWISLGTSFAVLVALVFSSGRAYPYLFIPLVSFAGLGIILLFARLLEMLFRRRPDVVAGPRITPARLVICAVAILVITVVSNGTWAESKLFGTSEGGTERIASLIREGYGDRDGEPNILFFNSGDIGIMELAGATPQVRFFYAPVISYDVYPEMIDAQIGYIRDGIVDYIVLVRYTQEQPFDFSELNDDYVPIAQEEQPIDGATVFITLYEKR